MVKYQDEISRYNVSSVKYISNIVVVVVKPTVGLAKYRNNIFYNNKNPRRALTNMRHNDTLNTY